MWHFGQRGVKLCRYHNTTLASLFKPILNFRTRILKSIHSSVTPKSDTSISSLPSVNQGINPRVEERTTIGRAFRSPCHDDGECDESSNYIGYP